MGAGEDLFSGLLSRSATVSVAARSVLHSAFRMVYPPTCAGCSRMTGGEGALCADCWRDVAFIDRPFCEVLGIPFARDHGAGVVSAQAIADPPPFDRLRAVASHEGTARKLVHRLKYQDRTDLARFMALWMLRASDGTVDSCDCIVPVPLHRHRFWRRRFNQSAELARHLAKATGKPLLAGTLLRVKPTERQVGLSALARQDNVRGAFAIAPSRKTDVYGKRVVLVDDVYTTGATVGAASRVLRKAGATDVTVLTFAMAISGPI
ncbi:ComF family protein [Agrobacterium tumefaciens]|uniref:ComF family protein n=1 Tax=Agrobacterium tumefaciens TaxID=358 RepID=UPI000DD38BD3|nr:ComF family protein [Agrobacterium tumefaciens]NSZ70325.1 ComF family protein [Agrobacterium tumefaciens]